MTIRFIHLADVHLKVPLKWASYDTEMAAQLRAQTWKSLRNVFEAAEKKDIDLIFIPGDLFESDYFTLKDYERLEDIFRLASNVKIFVAFGNHDAFRTDSYFRNRQLPANIFLFSGEKIEYFEFPEQGIRVYGLSWTDVQYSGGELPEIVTNPEWKNFLLLHCDVGGRNPNYLNVSKERLLELPFDYIALGHVHKPTFFADHIAYSGCLVPADFGDVGVHGYIQGVVGDDLKTEFVVTEDVLFEDIEVEISSEMSFEEIFQAILAHGSKKPLHFVRVFLTGTRDPSCLIDVESLKYEAAEHFYYIDVVDKTHALYDVENLKMTNRDNVLGRFIERLSEENMEEEIRDLAMEVGIRALLESQS